MQLPYDKLEILASTPEDSFKEAFPGINRDELRRMKREYLSAKEHNPLLLLKENRQLSYELQLTQRQLKETIEKGTAFDIMAEKILSVVPKTTKYPPLDIRPPKPSSLRQDEWILVISDIQLGSKIGKDETGGLGNYSFEVFKKRMQFLIQSVRDIAKYRANLPKSLRIFFLGDIIDGSTIFKGQKRTLDLMTIEQVMYGTEYLTQMVYEFAKIFPEVKCYGVPGNHGRIGEKGENWLMDNLDMLVYHWVRERLMHSGIENVSFDIPRTWYQLVHVNGWTFLLEHGDSFKGWAGIPFYGASRTKMNFQNMLQDYQIEFVSEEMRKLHLQMTEKFHYLMVGDKHVEANFSNIFMNGCWPGGSELSLKYMQSSGYPMQLLISVDRDYGANWVHKIFLEKPRTADRKLPVYS